MEPLPFSLQELGVLCNEPFGTPNIAIGDPTYDFPYLMRRQIDLHNGTCACDVHMRRRVVERVDADLEPSLANERGHRPLVYRRPSVKSIRSPTSAARGRIAQNATDEIADRMTSGILCPTEQLDRQRQGQEQQQADRQQRQE